MTKQIVTVLGGTGQQGGGVVDALLGAGKFAVRVASRKRCRDGAADLRDVTGVDYARGRIDRHRPAAAAVR